MERFQLVPEGNGEAGAEYEAPETAELRLGRDLDKMREPAGSRPQGRVATYQVASEHDMVSGYHARVYFDDRRRAFYLVDPGSTNGTFLNNNRIPKNEPQPLRSGDGIRLGKNGPSFRFNQGHAVMEAAPRGAGRTVVESEPAAAPPRPGYVRCPECGEAVSKADASRHPHPIALKPTGPMPLPGRQEGIAGSTIEFVGNFLGKTVGQQTAEFFKKGMQRMVDKHVQGRLRALYAALVVVSAAGAGSFYYQYQKGRKLQTTLELSQAQQEQLKRDLQAAQTAIAAEADILITPAAKQALFQMGLVLVPKSADPYATPPEQFLTDFQMVGTGWAVKPDVIMTNAHVGEGLQEEKAGSEQNISRKGLDAVVIGAALRNGTKNDFVRFNIDEFKIAAEYQQKGSEEKAMILAQRSLMVKIAQELMSRGVDQAAAVAAVQADTIDAIQEKIEEVRSRSGGSVGELDNLMSELIRVNKKRKRVSIEYYYNDVAAVRVRSKGLKPLALVSDGELDTMFPTQVTGKAKASPKMIIAGYPGVIGRYLSGSTNATVVQGLLINRDENMLFYDAPGQSGASGSPILNRQMRIIGIHSMMAKETYSGGIPVPVIRKYLKAWGFN